MPGVASASSTLLKPVSAKISKSRAYWRSPFWEIVVETSKVFTTNKEKEEKNDEICKWIYDTIKNSFDNDYNFYSSINIEWPMTIENIKNNHEEELKIKQQEEEKKELETKKTETKSFRKKIFKKIS